MEALIIEMLEEAKKDKAKLIALKIFAAKNNNLELASQLRTFEKEHFQESEEHRKAKESAHQIALMLGFCELTVSDDIAYVILEAVRCYNKKKGKTSLKDAAKIQASRYEIFGNHNNR